MFQKKIFIFIVVGLLTHLSLFAMDMDRVNALAAQFAGQKATKTTAVVEVVAPVTEAVAPTAKAATASVGTVTEESLGLRKTNLYAEEAETIGEATTYGKAAAGSSKLIERAFENAPPMISHDVEGMLPIKIGNNSCTGCHMPEVAPSMKATAIPASHFASFRPSTAIGADGRITKEGKSVDNTSDLKTVAHKLDKLSGARFNCTLCHAPQSTQAPLVGNTFTPDFSANGAKSSNLIDTMNEGVEGAEATTPAPAPVTKKEPASVIEVVKVTIPEKVVEVVAVAVATTAVVATKAISGTVTEESLGLRKTNLYAEEAETIGEATTYGKAAAGSSKMFERAFENAPPMIPHDIEGMLPIKIGNNSCTGCHMPEVAPSMKATAIPKSHFASFRPSTAIAADGRISKDGKGVDNTSDLKTVAHKLDKLSGARFNCSQCHAPQSTQAPLVGNTFTPDFSADGAKSSNLIDTMNEGVQ